MSTDNTDDHDSRDESMSQTTRRGLLGALGVAGLASLGSTGASANLSGGPEADAMAEYRVPTYRVPESDLDSPGVVGRRVEITAGGATYDTGDQLVDLGDRWELVSPNYGSLSTDLGVVGELHHDYSDAYPHFPNQEFGEGPVTSKQITGVPDSVLKISDVEPHTSVTNPDFIADPFCFFDEDSQLYHMLAEVFDKSESESALFHSTAVEPSYWTPQGDVLTTSEVDGSVLNYPYTFKTGETVYHTHHTSSGNKIVLYKLSVDGTSVNSSVVQDPFFTTSDFSGQPEDPTIFPWGGKWWLFVHDAAPDPPTKYIYYRDDLLNGSWNAHPSNPVISDSRLGANGGRPILRGDPDTGNGWIEFFCRGDSSTEPTSVWSIAIEALTTDTFEWYELPTSPVAEPDPDRSAWNGIDVHHFDPIRGEFALIDGKGTENDWEIGLVALEKGGPEIWDNYAQNAQIHSDAIYFESKYKSIDGFAQDASNSGSIENLNNRVELGTGTTSGSYAELAFKFSNQYALRQHTWDDSREGRFAVNFPDTGGTKFIGSGQPGTEQHVAFEVRAGDLIGTVADGSTENETTLVSGVASDTFNLRFEFVPGQKAAFYVDEIKQGEITSNLPSGTTWAEFFDVHRVENSTSTDRLMRFKESRVAQYVE